MGKNLVPSLCRPNMVVFSKGLFPLSGKVQAMAGTLIRTNFSSLFCYLIDKAFSLEGST